ncbi:MAG: hypothetical protein ABW024_04995 [Microbacterium sp.]
MTTPDRITSAPLAGEFLPEIHALARRALLWAVLYGVFARASRGGCTALPDDRSVAVASGDPLCFSAAMGPAPLVWLVMALVFVIGIGRVLTFDDPRRIARVLSGIAWAMPIIVAVAFAAGCVWFFTASHADLAAGIVVPWVTVDIDVDPAG